MRRHVLVVAVGQGAGIVDGGAVLGGTSLLT
jgi:hypothetical protein